MYVELDVFYPHEVQIFCMTQSLKSGTSTRIPKFDLEAEQFRGRIFSRPSPPREICENILLYSSFSTFSVRDIRRTQIMSIERWRWDHEFSQQRCVENTPPDRLL